MAEYKVAKGKVGAHEKTLVANAPDTVVFEEDLQVVEITSDGSAVIYVTVDAPAPAVGDSGAYALPAVPCVRNIAAPKEGSTAVRLISVGTPTYSVAKVSA